MTTATIAMVTTKATKARTANLQIAKTEKGEA